MTITPREDANLIATFDMLLWYRPWTGSLLWRERTPDMFRGTWAQTPEAQANKFNGKYRGKKAGSVAQQKHRMITHQGEAFRADRIAWALYYGEWPKGDLRHLDGDLDNNRIENLQDLGAQWRRPANGPAQRPDHQPASWPEHPLNLTCTAWSSGSGRTCLPRAERPEGCYSLPTPTGMATLGHGHAPGSEGHGTDAEAFFAHGAGPADASRGATPC